MGWTVYNSNGNILESIALTDNSVVTAKIADNAVTTDKIANSQVTLAKLDNTARETNIQLVVVDFATALFVVLTTYFLRATLHCHSHYQTKSLVKNYRPYRSLHILL